MPLHNDLSPFGRHQPRSSFARLLALTRRPRSSWLGRRLGFVVRALGIALLRGRPLDAVSLGARMRLYPANNVSEKILLFTPQLFDPEERARLAEAIADEPEGFTFVDIGANVGGYALFAAALAGPQAKILAVEPQPDIFERLVFNVRQNPFATVKALECAIADRDGVVTLFVNPANNGESSVRFVNGSAGNVAVKVTARTLQGVLAEEGFKRLDALKIDVEGAEELVIQPFFRDVPPDLWPKLLILDNPPGRSPVECPALGEGGPYQIVAQTRSNSIYRRRS